MNCLVLGGGGFLGPYVCAALAQDGHSVSSLGRESDVSDALSGIDAVFHLARDPACNVSANLLPTLRLLEACVARRVKKLVFFSSGGTVYGIARWLPIPEDHPTEPICSYGIQKLAVEKYLALYHRTRGLDYAVLRVSNAYGERQDPGRGQGAVAAFLDRALRREPIELWGDGSVVRDYIHASDVARACPAVLRARTRERLFNIGSGIGLSLLEVIRELESQLGRRLKVRRLAPRPLDVPVNVLDTRRAQALLGWSPLLDFRAGLARLIRRSRERQKALAGTGPASPRSSV